MTNENFEKVESKSLQTVLHFNACCLSASKKTKTFKKCFFLTNSPFGFCNMVY